MATRRGSVSQGSGFEPDLFHQALYMPFFCRWRFEIKLSYFFFLQYYRCPCQMLLLKIFKWSFEGAVGLASMVRIIIAYIVIY